MVYNYKVCLPEKRTTLIKNMFKSKGIKFSSHNEIYKFSREVHRRSLNKSYDYGVALGNKLYSETRFQLDKPIHVELAWTSFNNIGNVVKHAMALIFYPYNNVIEFFDPTGWSETSTAPVDVHMKHVLTGIQDGLKTRYNMRNIYFYNMNKKSLNPDGHCNTWSFFYHYLRHLYILRPSDIFLNYVLPYYHAINDNKTVQRKLLGGVHKIFSTSNKDTMKNKLDKEIEKINISIHNLQINQNR